MADNAIIMFQAGHGQVRDLEIPLGISAQELIWALNAAFSLGITAEKMPTSYLKAENPIALIHGKKTLDAFGVHDGTIIRFES